MTTPDRLAWPWLALPVAGGMCGILVIGFAPALAGIGGDLGMIALAAVFAVRGVTGLNRILLGATDRPADDPSV